MRGNKLWHTNGESIKILEDRWGGGSKHIKSKRTWGQ